MPVKRRTDKRRVAAEDQARAWSSVFDAGFDFFADLTALGIACDAIGQPDRRIAADAWKRLGPIYTGTGTWAREQFGEPPCR